MKLAAEIGRPEPLMYSSRTQQRAGGRVDDGRPRPGRRRRPLFLKAFQVQEKDEWIGAHLDARWETVFDVSMLNSSVRSQIAGSLYTFTERHQGLCGVYLKQRGFSASALQLSR